MPPRSTRNSITIRISRNTVRRRTSRKLRKSDLALDGLMDKIGESLVSDLRKAARQSFRESGNLEQLPFYRYNKRSGVLTVGIRARGSSHGRPLRSYLTPIQDFARGTGGRVGQPPTSRTAPPSQPLVAVDSQTGRYRAGPIVQRIAGWVSRNMGGIENPLAYAIVMARNLSQEGSDRRPWASRVFNLGRKRKGDSLTEGVKSASRAKIQTLMRRAEQALKKKR